MTGLLAVQAIDVAIFGSLGGLWVLGALFIVLLYRWILKFEADTSVPEQAAAVAVNRNPPRSVPADAIAIAS